MSFDRMNSSKNSKGCPNRLKPSEYCSKKSKTERKSGKREHSNRSSRKVKKIKRKDEQAGKKCYRPGPKTNNPFLNFLRDVRKKHCGWSITKIAIEGAKCWCRMPKAEKQKYYMEACSMQKKSKKHKKGRSHRRGKKHSRSRGKC